MLQESPRQASKEAMPMDLRGGTSSWPRKPSISGSTDEWGVSSRVSGAYFDQAGRARKRSTSLDVPSLANLNFAALQGQQAATEATDFAPASSRGSQNRNSFRNRLKNQDTFGVPVPVDLDDEDDDAPSWAWALELIGPGILAALLYIAGLSIQGFKYFVPYDSGFAIVVLWSGSMIGGQLALGVGLPSLLGMLCSGILWKNAGDVVRGLPDSWGAAIRAFGLMNILMRGGLEMDIKAVRRLGPAAVRLTVMPGVTEALTVSLVASLVFGMPVALALALGFILGAVSPAVVVGGMFDLASRGYGVKKGVPSLVVAAASFDDVVAISGFSMCIGLAIGAGDTLMAALHGPVNIVAGIGCGLLGALICSMTRIWNKPWKRSAIILVLGVIFTFISYHLHFSGAGALASLAMSALASQFWQKGFCLFGGKLSLGADEHFPHEVEMDLAKVWRTLAEPLLFSVIGAALDFHSLDFSMIPKGCAVVICGVILRTAAAYFATFGAGLCFKERFFIALAWMPKATVQAALGSLPLNLIEDKYDKDGQDQTNRDQDIEFGQAILTTAVFSILLTAPVGLIVIQQLGPRWLEYGYPEEGPVDAFKIQISEETDQDLQEQDKVGVANVSEGDVGAGMGKKGGQNGGVAKKGQNFAAVMPMNDICVVEFDGAGESLDSLDHASTPCGQPPSLNQNGQDK